MKRYDLDQETRAYETWGVMEEHPKGDYVGWKDAEKLLKKIETYERMFDTAEKQIMKTELYEWLFENGCSICKDVAIREDGQDWVVYDVDGDLIARGRDPEEAAWGAWDRAQRAKPTGPAEYGAHPDDEDPPGRRDR